MLDHPYLHILSIIPEPEKQIAVRDKLWLQDSCDKKRLKLIETGEMGNKFGSFQISPGALRVLRVHVRPGQRSFERPRKATDSTNGVGWARGSGATRRKEAKRATAFRPLLFEERCVSPSVQLFRKTTLTALCCRYMTNLVHPSLTPKRTLCVWMHRRGPTFLTSSAEMGFIIPPVCSGLARFLLMHVCISLPCTREAFSQMSNLPFTGLEYLRPLSTKWQIEDWKTKQGNWFGGKTHLQFFFSFLNDLICALMSSSRKYQSGTFTHMTLMYAAAFKDSWATEWTRRWKMEHIGDSVTVLPRVTGQVTDMFGCSLSLRITSAVTASFSMLKGANSQMVTA